MVREKCYEKRWFWEGFVTGDATTAGSRVAKICSRLGTVSESSLRGPVNSRRPGTRAEIHCEVDMKHVFQGYAAHSKIMLLRFNPGVT